MNRPIEISASSSIVIRALLRDCEGEPILPEDVSSVVVNLFEYLPPHTPVSAYTGLNVGTECVLSEMKTDAHGNQFNFELNPHDGSNPLFPERQKTYLLEIVLTNQVGKPSAHSLLFDAL